MTLRFSALRDWVILAFSTLPILVAGCARAAAPPAAPLPSSGAVVIAELGPDSFPLDAVLEPDGSALWVTDRAAGVLRIDTRTSEVTRYPAPEGVRSPDGISRAPDGAIWYAAHRSGSMVRLDPASGAARVVPLPGQDSRPMFLAATATGVWFAARGDKTFGSVDPTGRSTAGIEIALPHPDPYAVLAADDGSVWVSFFTGASIARVDPTIGEARVYSLPGHRATARRMALAADGRLWYSATHRGTVGVIDPRTDEIVEHDLGIGGARPYGIAVGPDGRIWVGDAAADRAIGWDPRTGRSITVELRSGGAVPRTLVSDPANGFLWILQGEAGRVARIEFPGLRR
jgi:virginiamycin B lyase